MAVRTYHAIAANTPNVITVRSPKHCFTNNRALVCHSPLAPRTPVQPSHLIQLIRASRQWRKEVHMIKCICTQKEKAPRENGQRYSLREACRVGAGFVDEQQQQRQQHEKGFSRIRGVECKIPLRVHTPLPVRPLLMRTALQFISTANPVVKREESSQDTLHYRTVLSGRCQQQDKNKLLGKQKRRRTKTTSFCDSRRSRADAGGNAATGLVPRI